MPILEKSPTGIKGFDETTYGGLPRGRTALVCGGPGCGKTLFGMEFLVRGAVQYGEPGVFMAFEETAEELTENVASLGFNLDDLCSEGLLSVDHVYVERSEIEETGEYDLEGLFVRLGFAIDQIGAKRVVLDTLEALFSGFADEAILRAELRRLFRWLKEKDVTAVITAERGNGTLTRNGLEEYVSDCVILLDHRLTEQVATRRMRVVKYRGSQHGTNEYPFLIGRSGMSVLPVTSLGLNHEVTNERISTGIPELDAMFDGGGFYQGSSVLVTGTAGTGKSSIAAHLADAACGRDEKALYFTFEESPQQVVRNMRSIGIDLEPWVEKGLLRFHAARPSLFGLETHLATMHSIIEEFEPQVVVMDPITNMLTVGTEAEVLAMLTRMIDYLKANGVTAFFTSLTEGGSPLEQTEVGVSSLMDVWINLRFFEGNGERNRGLNVLKARGMSHSHQIREFLLTEEGIRLIDAYLGPSGVLMGAARAAQEMRESAEAVKRRQETESRKRTLERKRHLLEAQIAAMREEFEAEAEEQLRQVSEAEAREDALLTDREEMARFRSTDTAKRTGTPTHTNGERKNTP
ncbi:MAG: circadian clock protein KaiC [Armatimonadetes bacterium]|nr:circadian clock protein KaiC [Armatimonadota bacterium]